MEPLTQPRPEESNTNLQSEEQSSSEPMSELASRDDSVNIAPRNASQHKQLKEKKADFFHKRDRIISSVVLLIGIVLVGISGTNTGTSLLRTGQNSHNASTARPAANFNPNVGAVLPKHRVVAFYAVPDAEPTGPAYVINDDMLNHLRQQADVYQALDPNHPVQPGIDLVVSVPDGYPGPQNTYSHHVDADTIQRYIDFCQKNNLLLFLDLNFGQAPIMNELNAFLPYLEKYAFVHMAIDPEWMFPRHDGIPGTNLSNIHASDLNPIISAVASIPMQYHVPRKILIIHQYRSDGDTLANPYDAWQAEIADKRNLTYDPRVDVVIHVDSVGGYPGDQEDKIRQYTQWVQQDMRQYENFLYGGFKLFYKIEAKTRVMTPEQVLSLIPPPMVVTYGN